MGGCRAEREKGGEPQQGQMRNKPSKCRVCKETEKDYAWLDQGRWGVRRGSKEKKKGGRRRRGPEDNLFKVEKKVERDEVA